MKRKIVFYLVLIFALSLFGKDNLTSIGQACLIKKYSTQMPFFVDTTDVNGGKFKAQQLLASFAPPTITDYSKFPLLTADTAGIIHLTKPHDGTELCYLEFRIYASRFVKPKLHVASTSDFTVYVNGEKKDGSSGSNLKLPKATQKDIDLSLTPQYYSIGVCCLLKSKDEMTPAVKLAVSGDSTARLVAVPPAQSQLRKLTYDDIANYSAPYETTLSYNGTFILNKISTVLPGGDKTYLMQVIDRASGKRIMQTSDHLDAAWMPKTEKLYYVDKEAGVRVMKSLQPLTFETQEIARNIPEGGISWSPNEKFLIISSTDKYKEHNPDVKYYNLPHDRMSGSRNGSYLSKFDLATGAVQQLTFGNHDVYLQDICEDGTKLIFTSSETDMTRRPFNFSSFFEYNLETNKVDSIWTKAPFVSRVQYSPDGKQLLVLGSPAAFNKIGENMGKHPISNDFDTQAFLYDFATKKVTPLTRNFDPTITQSIWSVADNTIYFKVTDRDYERVYRYSPATKKFEMLPLQVDYTQQFDLAGNGLYATYRGMTASYPGRAFLLDIQTGHSTEVSDPEKEKMAGISLGKVEDFNYKGKDGVPIYGRYYLPSDFDATKKYPMMVYYYGGTTPTQRTFSAFWNFHFWASLGYVVYVVQPSGTIGFGQEFSARHVNAWGDQTADDIINGVKNFCAAHSYVNVKKIGCLGASYGGFMTMYLQTKTKLFATAISHAGISALSSYWGNGYWGYGYSSTATANTYPWNNPKYYTDHSPLFHADKITTPLLLIQGDDDTNVPPGESMQMYTGLKILGKTVSMIRIKGEDHIIMDYKHRKEWNFSIMAWMAKYLQDDGNWWENMYPESKKN